MGAGAEADVGDAAPVGAVVDRFAARARPVGDLVVHISGFRKHPAESIILRPALLVQGLDIAAVGHHTLQRAVLFNGQLIRGDMLRLQCQSRKHGVGPGIIRQLGQSENEVYADVVEAAGPQEAERLTGPCGVVPAVHPFQYPVVERLHPHTDAVHPESPQTGHILRTAGDDVVRIDLYGELFVIGRPEGADNILQYLQRQDRRGPSADVQGVRRRRA